MRITQGGFLEILCVVGCIQQPWLNSFVCITESAFQQVGYIQGPRPRSEFRSSFDLHSIQQTAPI